jgi:toxin ParE1/3/4
MPRVVRTRAANEDLIEIWQYISEHNRAAADRMLLRIDRACAMLGANPLLGEIQPNRPGMRRFVVRNYIIFYEPIDDGIRVMRVLHGARQWEDMI